MGRTHGDLLKLWLPVQLRKPRIAGNKNLAHVIVSGIATY
jgi:hypothetical protein